jgi:UDPglucose 6-dehydrogenase
MDARSAELTKYAANSMLATRISFMNEIANLCDEVGADVEHVRRGVGMDVRIGNKFLFPGVGYGGSCFPKDVKAAIATAREHGMTMEVLEAVHRTNERQKHLVFDRLLKHFHGEIAGRIVALWGLAFKPGTDDIREAPSLVIIEKLLAAGAIVHGHDPVAGPAITAQFGDRIKLFDNNYDAAEGASALAVLTEWNQYRRPNFDTLRERMDDHVLFDGRNVWEPEFVREYGFTYFGVGRR